MEIPPQLSLWDRSTTARFFRWLFRWRTVRRILIGLAWMATIIALLYGVENWRGRHAWNKYRQELEARGVQLDLKTFIPKPVSDEENFAATPFFEFLFASKANRYDWVDDFAQAQGKVPNPNSKRDKASRQLVDLVAWESAFAEIGSGQPGRSQKIWSGKLDRESRAKAAPAVLAALKDSDAVFEELRAASRRPHSRYSVKYDLEDPWGILLPHLSTIKAVVQRLQIKACAELAAGEGQNALEDVKLTLYLADSLKEEPFLISYLVRMACLQIAIQPIWEGLADRRWWDAQLQEIQQRLQQYDFLADLKHSLNSERAAGVLTVDLLFRRKYRFSHLVGTTDGQAITEMIARIAPRGWYYQEQLNYCRLFEQQLGGTVDTMKKRISPTQIAANAQEMERMIGAGHLGKGFKAVVNHHVIAALMLPALDKLPLKAASAQTAADQAALACALERYRLANGQFPETLESLVPHFMTALPRDLLRGEPYKYRGGVDGQFVLYSVGWNEEDDGGTPGNTLFDEKEADWVWEYPEK